ncbi:hypothetical protein QBC45DRAFT_452694 [Copromyces sp. CBS 386.78]|nr:hypothetical protein QBC45DRAFT_452694 [Copromyces sp. CBS 386.78]
MPVMSISTEDTPTMSTSTESTIPPSTPSAQDALEKRISFLEATASSHKELYNTIIFTVTRLERTISNKAKEALDNVLDEVYKVTEIMDDNTYIGHTIQKEREALARERDITNAGKQVVSLREKLVNDREAELNEKERRREAKLNDREQELALREHDVKRRQEALNADSVRARRDKEDLKIMVGKLQEEKGRPLTEETEEERMRLLDVATELLMEERKAEFEREWEAKKRTINEARRAAGELLRRQGQERSQVLGVYLRKRKADNME